MNSSQDSNTPKRVAVLAADGFEEIELVVPFDILREAGLEVDLVSVNGAAQVTGTNGLIIDGCVPLEGYDFSAASALVVPGGAGYAPISASEKATEQIRAFGSNPDKVLGAICAGASIPGKLGLYKGKKYTVVPGMDGDFGGSFEKKHAVVDGNVVTGISVGGAFEFAFDLVTRICGEDMAKKLRKQTFWEI